jgi:hypothetical protein
MIAYVIDANRSDNYPLMQPFDISTVPLDLPNWAYALPSPTPENIQNAAPAANQTPAATQLIDQTAVVVIVAVVLVAVTLALMLTRKRRSSN